MLSVRVKQKRNGVTSSAFRLTLSHVVTQWIMAKLNMTAAS